MLAYIDPEGELHSAIVGGAEGKVYRGHDGFRKWLADSFESFEELRIEWTEYRDLGDRVIAFGHIHARGRESGLELDSPTGWVFTVRGGKVVKGEGFLTRAEALEAAGLSE
jgi:ketosteroid isomerase-like protein